MKKLILFCFLIVLLVGSVTAIELRAWDVAPYNIGIGNYYVNLDGVKKIKQKISHGDCVYPVWLDTPIVYGDYIDYSVTRNHIDITLKDDANYIEVFTGAKSKTSCDVGP